MNGSFTFRFDRMSFLFNMYDVLTRWILMTVQIDIMHFALGRTCTLVQSDHDTLSVCLQKRMFLKAK